MDTYSKLVKIMDAQKGVLINRNAEVDGVWLSLLSGEHGFLFGPPGVAKSMIVEDAARYFSDFGYFFHLMGKHTVPEELFGPISISALRNDKFEFNTASYLPEADIAFLDEGFKANGAILNTLLRIMNERQFRNGTVMHDAPLKSMFIASNEIPEEAELAALYDRILFRFNVQDLQHPEDMLRLLMQEEAIREFMEAPPVEQFTREEFESIHAEVAAVTISRAVKNNIVKIRDNLLHDHNITASSRRWLRTLKGIRAHAYLHGRTEATEEDLMPLTYMLWSQLGEISAVNEIVWNVANPVVYQIMRLKDTITILLRDMNTAIEKDGGKDITLTMAEYIEKLTDVHGEISRTQKMVPDNQVAKFKDKFQYMLDVVNGQKARIGHLGMGLDLSAVAASIIPWRPEQV